MARASKEKDSTYNKAYYDKLMNDPKRRAERSRKNVLRQMKKNEQARVERWEQTLLVVASLRKSGRTDQEIAKVMAEDWNITKVKRSKHKWIDFSPSSKSLSSLSSSAASRPARTQEDGSA